MANLSRAAIEAEDVVCFLKKDIHLKEVAERILYQKVIDRATQERGIEVTPEEIQAEGDRFRHENRLEKASDTLAWLADQMISPEDWEAGIGDRLLAKKLADALFSREVEKFFAQNRVDFDRVLLYQIIVPYEKVARELVYQIEEQEITFYEAAHLYDIEERRRLVCGYEGKILRSALPPEIAAAIFSAPVGEIVGPVKTPLGYHVLLVEEFIRAELTSELREQIIDNMFKQWLASELNYMLHSEV